MTAESFGFKRIYLNVIKYVLFILYVNDSSEKDGDDYMSTIQYITPAIVNRIYNEDK